MQRPQPPNDENMNYLTKVSHLVRIVQDSNGCNLQLYKIHDLDYFVVGFERSTI